MWVKYNLNVIVCLGIADNLQIQNRYHGNYRKRNRFCYYYYYDYDENDLQSFTHTS